jgi:amino acid adenylation domain-containing protein
VTNSESAIPDGIAIVGLAGRFPGARDAAEFWRNLSEGRDGIVRFSDEQLAANGYDPAKLRSLPGYVGARGTIEKPEWFDRNFFSIPPKEAEVMDPQHRVFLEVAWEALEDAACDPSRYPGLIGVFAGMSNNTYYPYFVRQRRDLLDAVGIVSAVIANEKDFLTTRLAYKLDLRGPALNIQTACSSSLVTVCVACQNLLDHQCDVALAGGVSLTFPQDRGYFYQDGSMTSPDGWCRPFDERANGTVFSHGAGAVVLKRLADAIADGDHIYTVIKGHALNNDGGQKVGFAAPSVNGHTEVISLAQAVAGVSPDTISYIEAHGTATPLGDPVEIAGLTNVFRGTTEAKQFCALGSVKGNIGHCDAASGIASLIKLSLAFQNEQLPPTLHCEQPNPALHLEDSPFFLNTTLREWPRAEAPRRAGVSSFGVGGTNAHLVLEEAPQIAATRAPDSPQLLVLSAKTASALEKKAQALAAHLEASPASLADVAFTLHEGRQPFSHRRAIVASTVAEAVAALRAPAKLHRVEDRRDTSVAFLFPGQGSQYPGMGARLFAHEPVFRAILTECAEVLKPELGLDLCDLLFSRDTAADERLRETRFTQPAIFAVSYALARLWQSRGIEPVALVGHSVGEFVAAALAGVFSWQDAARLVALRARLTQELPRGAMLAARLGEAEATEFLADPRVSIAAINSPKLCVLAGPFEAIEALEAEFALRNITARRLATSHAFHSPMVEPVVEPLAAAVRAIKLNAPTIPIISSVTGEPLTEAQATDPQYWAHHLRATVRFSTAVGRLLAERSCVLLEAGPGQTLSQLVRQNTARTPLHEVAFSIAEEVDEQESLAAAFGRLWLAGVPLDWRAAHPGQEFRRLSLPTYPFERQRYFADLPAGVTMPITTAATDGEAPPEAESLATVMVAVDLAETTGATVAVEIPVESGLTRVKQLLTDLSGIDLHECPGSTSLLDLGFDSLFLSQAALTMTRKFGAKITVRQLLGDLGTLDALAAAIPAQGAPAQPKTATPAATVAQLPAPAANAAHGPFRPVQRDLGATLDPKQQAWLADFITRYNARTGASKKHTQQNRAFFADPRAVAGFKQQWKEIVYPVVANRSLGARLWDIDGNEWLDLTISYGAAMLGHQPPFVVEAIKDQLSRGMEIGPTSPLAGEVAALICELTGAERATFCNTGSEAVTGALRAARTVTGKPKMVYFRESYHGIDNEVLGRRAGEKVLPIAPGIPDTAVSDTIILEYGDPQSLAIIAANANDIAAVIVEPVQSRHPALQPGEFLHELRKLTEQQGIALIFDEIISGFRCHPGGAQGYFGIRADLATYGKVIGGGLPIGAIAGKAEYMDAFDGGAWSFGDESFPGAAVTFFAGTFVRHPLALAAARAVLTHLKQQGVALQNTLAERAGRMIDGIKTVFAGTPFSAQCFTSNWLVVPSADFKYSGLLFALLRHRGIHIWENRPCFVSTAHTDADLEQVVKAFAESIEELRNAGFFSASQPAAKLDEGSMPITVAQQEIWMVCQQGQTASNSFNETWTLLLDGPLDDASLRQSIQTVVDRHQSLRSTFAKSGETMAVTPSLQVEIPLRDLSPLGETAAHTELAKLRAAEGARTFDLERGPLLALQLVRLAPQKHALIFNAHHLVCDGWSCDVFLNEISALYSAAREGKPQQLPAPMTMRDYERFMAELRETPDFAADAAYWLERYRTLPPALTLPGDRPYPKRRSFRGASEQIVLPTEFSQALSRFGAQQGATLFSVLLAGFKTLLFRLSGQGDLSVGVPSAGQNLAGGDHLIGHCVNMLPLRSSLAAEQTFAALLKEVQGTVLDAFEHQRVTFGWLLRQLSFSREPGRVPLIPVTFNVDPPLSHLHFHGLEHRLEANPRSAFQFDLGFNCDTTPRGFRLICHYNADLFDAATIRRWLGLYRALLTSVSTDPTQPLGRIPFDLTAPEPASEPSAPQHPALVERAPLPVNTAVEFWPSSPSAGDDGAYDEVLYNAMTLDKSRHDAYRRAFEQLVSGKVVVDIGTGRDALLARMSVEAGARKVYAIELLQDPAEKARALVEDLGLSERISVIHGRSQDVALPEKVDVCVSENVGHIGGTEGCDFILDDARSRFLKPGGVVIPNRCETRIAAVCLPPEVLEKPLFEPLGGYYAEQLWQRAGYKHDFRLCVTGMSRAYLRSTDDLFEDVDFRVAPVREYDRPIRLEITADSHIDGFLLWLRLETAPGATLESIDHHDSWLPVYLPAFCPAIEVKAGDRIEATVHGSLADNGFNRDYRITGRVIRKVGGDFDFSFDSWHYKKVYRHTPFYRRLFSDDAVPVAARSTVPTEWNGTQRPFPASKGVHQLFEEQAARTPDAVAVESSIGKVTYAELNRRANRVARSLQGLGVSRGASVGLCVERSIELIVGILGILKAGGAYLPLDPSYPSERIALMIEDTAAPIVLAQRKVAGRLPRTAARLVEIESLELTTAAETNLDLPGDGAETAYVMFTSGSTGKPKGSAIPHRGISRLVINTDYVEFTPQDIVAQVSNTSFDASTFEIWGALLNGSRLVVITREALLEPRGFVETLRRSRISILFLTTPLFHQFAREVPGGFGSLRYLVVGGDALEAEAARAVLESNSPPEFLVNGYGPTETTTFAICHRVASIAPGATNVPIGRPIANTQVYLLDSTRKPVPPGEPGEIYIGGPGVARGYLNRPELTAECFVPDLFATDHTARLYRTGDRARWLPTGAIEFLGRIDDQLKVRGFRVELGEIEAALREHPAVSQCKVVARANGVSGKTLSGYITARRGQKVSGDEVREFLQKRLPDFMVPASVSVLPAFPLNANGKIDLQALPAEESKPVAADEPSTAVEQGIAALWEEVLGRNHLSLHDDFFLVGGHSLLAIRLIGRLRERFSVDVPVQRLFETPTISGLAEFVSSRMPAAPRREFESIVMIQRGEESKKPLFLVPGGWGGEIEFLVYRQLGRQLDPSQPLYGLRARGSNAESLPEKTVEEFAAEFVEEICAFQPEGPYFLGGECVGGIVAYEMVRQLTAAGKEVALLLLLDTEWPNSASLNEFVNWERKRLRDQIWEARVIQPAKRHWQRLGELSFTEKFRYLWERIRRRPFRWAAEPVVDPVVVEREVLTEYPRKLMAHQPKTHQTKVTLLLDAQAHEQYGNVGWDQKHPGPLEIHIVPGDHVSYIREHAADAAAKLREILAAAQKIPSC